MQACGKIIVPFFLLCAFLGLLYVEADGGAKIPYPLMPDWISSDYDYATGCGFGDIDKDGWPDLVVANGNDMNRERIIVYYNQGDGTYPSTPDWTSSDIDYHGHLSIGDVNGDGWLDVAVSVFLGPAGFSEKGYVKLYLNDGAGTLSGSPSWTSGDTCFTFSCALGDADGDGDLDLAVACGEGYQNPPDKNRIYFNNGGTLDSLPGWKSDEIEHSMDAAWADMDNDGDLDLAFCNSESPMRIYYSVGGSIQTTAGWSSSSPASPSGNSLSLGDINNDGYMDFSFSDNSQLGGRGRFIAYLSDGLGGLNTTPDWQSEYVGYTSGIVLCDVQGDGWKDVIGGSWWGSVRIYLNDHGVLSVSADSLSNTNSVVEAIPLGDADKKGLRQTVGEGKSADGVKKVFTFNKTPVVSVEQVVVDGVPLSPSQFCYESETGWISLAAAPVTSLSLDYTSTTSADFAISNWDSSKGNYLFCKKDLTATLRPPLNLNVPRGSNLPIIATLANHTSTGHLIFAQIQIFTPWGPVFDVGSGTLPLPAFRILTGGVPLYIPTYTPLGNYTMQLIMKEGGTEVDEDNFTFQVVN